MLLLLNELALDLAQELLGDSQVGGDEVLGDSLLDLGVLLSEVDVAIPGRHAEVPDNSLL